MKKTTTQVVIALLALTTFSCTKEQLSTQNSAQSSTSEQVSNLSASYNSDSLNKVDKNYLITAAEGSELEIILGNMAQTHAKNNYVKSFGLRMVEDHSKEHKQVKEVADSVGITVPDHPSKDEQEEIQELSKYYGSKFDKMYMSYEVWDHKNDVADASNEYADGYNRVVKRLALKWLPILISHLRNAQQVAKRVDAPPYHE